MTTKTSKLGLRASSLLDRRHMMLLRAALGENDAAAAAYAEWRSSEQFSDVDDTIYRVLPLLLAQQQRSNIADPDAGRMQGAAKHIWLSNILRLQQLADAAKLLREADINFMVIKGGALFARQPHFAAMRAAGDYDIQVDRKDAKRAINVLTKATFQPLGIQTELFNEEDFDLAIHAVAFANPKGGGSIDLHWRPIPSLFDPDYVTELFSNATELDLFGQKILVPGLADHLFLALARCEPWDIKETFLRAVEITHLLRTEHAGIDWTRLTTLIDRNGAAGVAANVLALLRDELDVPMQNGLPERLWQMAGPGKATALKIGHRSPHQRKRSSAFLLSLIQNLHKRTQPRLSWRRLAQLSATQPNAIVGAVYDSLIEAPLSERHHVKRLWKWHARQLPVIQSTRFARGFSIPEAQGRWTDGRYAVLIHPVAKGTAPVVSIILTLVPFLPPGAPAFAFEMTAGHDVAQATLAPTTPLPARLAVRGKVLPDSDRIVIAFKLIDANIPQQIGHSEDPRMLGLFVQNIEIAADVRADDRAGH